MFCVDFQFRFFADRILVPIVPVPGHCLVFNFILNLSFFDVSKRVHNFDTFSTL